MAAPPAQWKVLVVDENSRKLINGAVKEEEILNLNVSSKLVCGPRTQDNILRRTVTPADVEQIEHRRMSNPDMDALYILSPESWIVDCLMADFEAGRYRKAYLVWTSCQWAATPGPRRRAPGSQFA